VGPSDRSVPAQPPRLVVLEIARLRCHEKVQPDLLARTIDRIRRDGKLRKPILVADRDFVILDGHHRYEALRAIGCSRIPAYVVDYFSDIVEVSTWPGAVVREVTKEEVIRRGLAGPPFPPKTSRHTVRAALQDSPMDLKALM